MDIDAQTVPQPLQHRIRLLLPFFMDRNALREAERGLTRWFQQAKRPSASALWKPNHATLPVTPAKLGIAGKAWPCWAADAPPSLYEDEILPSVRAFLFNKKVGGCCGYLRVPDATANFWFKNGGVMAKATGMEARSARPLEFQVRLADPGIELFLSPHGVGVLSVTFEPKTVDDLLFLREFNYRLSQVRDYTAYRFRLPRDGRNPNPPPHLKAPLAQRLGHAGGEFTLIEWAEFLLRPLHAWGYRRAQEQFSVYSVTRFDASADFADPAIQAKLRPYLAATAHIEEYNHPGSLDITERVLSPRHWAAVGSLGAAHLAADQGLTQGFDEQRLPLILHKYFVSYLLALLQRTTLLRILEDARIAITKLVAWKDGSAEEQSSLVAEVRGLNSHTLAFTVNGFFTEASSREAHNQYYVLAQQGLRVRNSFETLQRALHDAEIMDNDRFQNQALGFQTNALVQLHELASQQQRTIANLEKIIDEANASIGIVADVQSKVEWLEVFFVSYYATALVYYINHDGTLFKEDYTIASLILAPVLSGLTAFFGLGLHKPQQQNSHDKAKGHGKNSYRFLVALAMLFTAWLGVGYSWFRIPETGEHPAKHEAPKLPPSNEPKASSPPGN